MESITRHFSYANVAATLALVLAMGGGALAATGGFSSGGTLQACVSSKGGLRLLKPGKRCPKGLQTVAWNQDGPAGPRGAPGEAGAKGADGAKGASGESADVKWAAISAAGKILAAHGVVAVVVAGGPSYAVAFNSDITNCALTATSNEGLQLTPTVTRAGTEVRVYFDYVSNEVLTNFSVVANC